MSSSEYGGTHRQRKRTPWLPAAMSCQVPGGIKTASPATTALVVAHADSAGAFDDEVDLLASEVVVTVRRLFPGE